MDAWQGLFKEGQGVDAGVKTKPGGPYFTSDNLLTICALEEPI